MRNKEIKMGVYRSGSSLKVIAECDLITQENGHKDEAIYLAEISVMKDPREDFTEDDLNKWKDVVRNNFADYKFGFKAKDRKEADTFITYNTPSKWETLRELSTI